MKIQINDKDFNGIVSINEKVSGCGSVSSYSWLLSSTSRSLTLEIAEDPNLTPQDLPLVGFGCGGWIFESELSSSIQESLKNQSSVDESEVTEWLNQGFALFAANKLEYIPAVNSACSQ